MKLHTEPTLTKNDPCSNKGHHINSFEIIQHPYYYIIFYFFQAEIKQMALMHKLRSQKEALGLTDEQLRKVIRLALAYQAKP